MRLWTHYGDPEPDDLEALGMVEVNPNIEAAVRLTESMYWTHLVPRPVHLDRDVGMIVTAALTPGNTE